MEDRGKTWGCPANSKACYKKVKYPKPLYVNCIIISELDSSQTQSHKESWLMMWQHVIGPKAVLMMWHFVIGLKADVMTWHPVISRKA